MNDQFLQGVIFDWNRIDNDSYLNRIKAFKGIEKLVFNKPITFFVGENGSGKSTLLEALAVAHGFNPEGGTKNYVFSTHDTHSELCDAIRISKGYRKEKWGYFLRAESFYNVATKEEEYADLTHPSACLLYTSCHYLQIVELIVELGPEEQEDWTFGSLVYEEEKYSIGIPTVLYKELLPIAEGKEENLLEKLLEKISSKETYLLDIVPDEALLWMV